ncbi:MAG: type II toxin-antitoxin system RelE/ParE family toxin [Gemmatimonadaceae bacterium]
MTLPLRWTEHAVDQLGGIVDYVSLASPVYAELLVDRLVMRLAQATTFPLSGRIVPEFARVDIRELIEPPYRLMYRPLTDCIEVIAIMHSGQSLRGAP